MANDPDQHVRSIALCIVLTLVTCGIYNFIWQYRQMDSVNEMLGEDKYNFVRWLLLTLVTCGIYHVYHEYRFSEDIARVTGHDQKGDALVSLLLSVFGLSVIVDAIQQSRINAHFGDTGL